MVEHGADLAGIVGIAPVGLIGGVAKAVALHGDEPQLEPFAHRLEEIGHARRACAGARAADEQHGTPLQLARIGRCAVGEMHDPPRRQGQGLNRRTKIIETVGESGNGDGGAGVCASTGALATSAISNQSFHFTRMPVSPFYARSGFSAVSSG
jgi:hypothetical protein